MTMTNPHARRLLWSRVFALLFACVAIHVTAQSQMAPEDEPELAPVSAPSKTRIAINKKYFEICEAELGPFPKEAINCPDAVLIPTERTLADGSVMPLSDKDLSAGIPRFRGLETGQLRLTPDSEFFDDITSCDKPSGIFRDMSNAGCVSGNRIKHMAQQIKGGQVVDWTYICRRNSVFPQQGTHYNELGLIGYNRSTGKTCYFAGQPTQTLKLKGQWKVTEVKDGKPVETIRTQADMTLIDGNHIPAPSFSKFDEKMVRHWSVPTLGGCTGCHSNGPFVRYPFNEPVCLVSGGSSNCLKSFAQAPACESHIEQTYARGERYKYRCRVLKPKREPGMLYSVVSPFEAGSELNKFLTSMSDADKRDSYYKDLMTNPWNHPQRLVSTEAKACTQCHEIGNTVYASTFINSMFSVHKLNDGRFEPDPDEIWRTRLFLSNVSKTQRSESAHDVKIKVQGILPIKVSASSIKEENDLRQQQSLARYQSALRTINMCGLDPKSCQWDSHWTLERVAQQPLQYLQERCSYCHNSDMAQPVLATEADFKRPEVLNKIIGRINEPINPMPPSGQLPRSVLPLLTDYLRK